MRRALVLGLLVGAGAAGLAAAGLRQQAPEFEPIGQIQKVRNNLYMIPGQGGNTAVFVTRSGVVLVDTKLGGNGQAILDRVAAVADVPVTMIINTHAHFDHVGSNAFFSPSVEVVTHENARAAMAGDETLKQAPHALADRTFRDRLTIGSGPDRIDLYHFGPAHTNGDAFIVFPAVRAMAAGDLFPWKAAPFLDAEAGGTGVGYPDTLDRAIQGMPNVDTVIPGHMAVTTWGSFVEYAAFTRELLRVAQAAKKAGRTAEQAVDELARSTRFAEYVVDAPIPGFAFLGTARERARLNVEQIFKELP